MARKRHFLEGFDPSVTDPKPGDIIYRKGAPKPTDEEIIRTSRKEHLRHRRIEVYMGGTIVLAGFAKLFGLDLPILLLLPLGAVLGVILYYVDGMIRDRAKR
jgi:hypothetical protein